MNGYQIKIKMGCSVLDFKCILVNELVGSVTLAVLFIALLYFMIASKMKFGFDTTLVLLVPLLIISSLVLSVFSGIYAFITLIAGLLLGYIFIKFIENR